MAEGRFRRTNISSYSNTGIEELDSITFPKVTVAETLGVSGAAEPNYELPAIGSFQVNRNQNCVTVVKGDGVVHFDSQIARAMTAEVFK